MGLIIDRLGIDVNDFFRWTNSAPRIVFVRLPLTGGPGKIR
jgi:hypothetical protein